MQIVSLMIRECVLIDHNPMTELKKSDVICVRPLRSDHQVNENLNASHYGIFLSFLSNKKQTIGVYQQQIHSINEAIVNAKNDSNNSIMFPKDEAIKIIFYLTYHWRYHKINRIWNVEIAFSFHIIHVLCRLRPNLIVIFC